MAEHASRRRQPLDYTLLTLTLGLLALGLLMTYSASAILADQRHGDPLYFVKRQVSYAAAGILAMRNPQLYACLRYEIEERMMNVAVIG